MELTTRSFLQFLRNLISLFRKRWDQSTRRLWYIFALLCSRFSPRHPKKNESRRRIEPRPAKPSSTSSTAVICASQFPTGPKLTPIPGGHTPFIASPEPTVSIQIRRPTILDTEDDLYESHENQTAGHLDIDGFVLGQSGSISRPHDAEDHNDGPEPIHIFTPHYQEGFTSNHPVIPPRPDSIAPSESSYRSTSQYASHRPYRPGSQYSRRLSEYSVRSLSNLHGAEAAARGFTSASPALRPPSPTPSRAPSIAGSVVYRASRPVSRVRKPAPMKNAPRSRSKLRARSSPPASARHSIHEAPPDVPKPPQPDSRATGSVHGDRHSEVVNLYPSSAPSPDGKLRPMIAIDRYEKQKHTIIADDPHEHICLPVTTQFVLESPENWIPLVHPEGALYWVHKEDPVYTDTNMRDPVLRQRIEEALAEIYELRESSPPLPAGDWELALELGEDSETGKLFCWYYFACHSTRCLFWLHQFDLLDVLFDLRGVTELTHIHMMLQSQYWNHWETYPHDREVPEHLIQELIGILVHAGVDCMTSRDSTTVYPEVELCKLIKYVKDLKSVGGNYGFSACVVGRLLSFFAHSRFVNFYGQTGARLTNDHSIYGYKPKRTFLITMLSVFFFYAPELHLRGLESVYTDFIICRHRWMKFMTQLQNDWTEFILYGTVLLNANVAFLAIPSVDPGNHTRTATQIASYTSIITSVGSIVIGLLLLRQHRTKPEDAAEEVDGYLRSRRNNALGFETLAILYSLPYSLLLWSTMAFSAAFGLETLVFSRQLWARLSVGVVLAMMVLLICWCIWTTVEAQADFSVLERVHSLKDRLVGFTRRLRGKTPEPGPDAGDGEGGDSQSEGGILQQSGTSTEAFKFWRRRRRTSATLVGVNLNMNKRSHSSPDGTGVKMSGIKKGPENEV